MDVQNNWKLYILDDETHGRKMFVTNRSIYIITLIYAALDKEAKVGDI